MHKARTLCLVRTGSRKDMYAHSCSVCAAWGSVRRGGVRPLAAGQMAIERCAAARGGFVWRRCALCDAPAVGAPACLQSLLNCHNTVPVPSHPIYPCLYGV